MLVQKAGDSGIGDQAIGAFDDSMAFVLETQVFNGYLALAQGGDDLLGFADGHARVVGTMNDDQRRGDAFDMTNWRNLFQKFAIFLQTAVLAGTQFTPPGMGVSRKVTKLAIPTISTAAAQRSG